MTSYFATLSAAPAVAVLCTIARQGLHGRLLLQFRSTNPSVVHAARQDDVTDLPFGKR